MRCLRSNFTKIPTHPNLRLMVSSSLMVSRLLWNSLSQEVIDLAMVPEDMSSLQDISLTSEQEPEQETINSSLYGFQTSAVVCDGASANLTALKTATGCLGAPPHLIYWISVPVIRYSQYLLPMHTAYNYRQEQCLSFGKHTSSVIPGRS